MLQNDKQEKFIVPIGPQHPALKEPGHFEFTVDGEIVTAASVRLGFVHRGIEKGTESRNWNQNLYLLERICGICSHVHAFAYALGVEKLAGVTVPPRGQAIRVIVAEMERVHSHMLWLGVAAHEAGFDTLFMYTWRDREVMMDLLETLCGNRVNYSANVLGGVKCDVSPEIHDKILKGLDYLGPRTEMYLKLVTTEKTLVGRTRGIGFMTKETAEELGTVGPTARASGLTRDVRVEAPYSAYVDFPINAVVEQAGDLEARFVVRIKELFESYRLIRTIVEALPEGEISTRVPRRIPEGETVSRVEAPRGELFYFIKSNGSDMPERIKVRTPSINNFASVIATSVGHKLADIPMILSGIDPCFSCNDRMITLKKDGVVLTPDWDEIRKYGIEYYK